MTHEEKCVAACSGLPDGALDGGWTAAGIIACTIKLEDEILVLKKLNAELELKLRLKYS